MLLFHENIQRYIYIFFPLWKGKGEAEGAAVLQHPLPCQVCPAGPSWQRHQCSLGTASVPCPQGASAPLEAKIYCWEGGLCFRDSAWRVSYPGTLVSAWGAGEGAELFSQACPFRPQSQAQGGFVAPYLLLRLWKVCQKKEVIFFFFVCVWELPGNIALYFYSAPLQAKQIRTLLWEEETCAAQSLPAPGLIPWLIFPGKEPGSIIPHLQWGQWLETPLGVLLLPQRAEP